MSDEIVLEVKGKKYGGWTEVTVKKSMFNITGAFGFRSTDIYPGDAGKWDIVLGDVCEVKINDQTLITGYIEDIPITYSNNRHSIQMGGRDKTGDLVDCSFIEDAAEWKSQTVASIIGALCAPFGIDVVVDESAAVQANAQVSSERVDSFVANQGMSIFEIIVPILKDKAILPVSYGDGKLTLTRAGITEAKDNLEFGTNIKAGSINQSNRDRFATYIVKGQSKGDDFKTDTSIYVHPSGIHTDEVITRYRPLIILPDEPLLSGDCLKRAKWEASIRAGKSRQINYEVQGWTQSNGEIWPLNALVRVKDSFLGIDGTLLIAAISFTVGDSGTTTNLTLVDPQTFELLEAPIKTIKTKFDPSYYWEE
jgi:prophage tail gpP-like protein